MKHHGKGEMKVYFNSACPVCRAGINLQRKQTTSCHFIWNDIHQDNGVTNEIGKDLNLVRKYLHVKDRNGELLVGISAFIAIWENSPKDNWKAKAISLPLVRQFAQTGYLVFANFLYAYNRASKRW